MLEKLLKIKANAEHDILYAKAKLEVVSSLLADVVFDEPTVEEDVTEEVPVEEIESVEV